MTFEIALLIAVAVISAITWIGAVRETRRARAGIAEAAEAYRLAIETHARAQALLKHTEDLIGDR